MAHTLLPAAAAVQQVLAEIEAAVLVLPEVAVVAGAEVPAAVAASVPPGAETPVRELVPPGAVALAAVEVCLAARVELAQEQAPIAQDLL